MAHQTHDPHWWTAYLATTIRHAIDEPPPVDRRILENGLKGFVQSEACTPELRQIIQAKGEK